MLDRGCAAGSSRPSSARRARPPRGTIQATGRQARPDGTCRRSRSTRRAHATSTTRSPPNAWWRRSANPRTRVWVHIADVSAYVPEGSLVDLEARRRGTSVYVPGAVEPMLPEALSNDACSLVPGKERAAVTVELELHGAKVAKAAFYRSLIRSDERLSYEQVDRDLRRTTSGRASPGPSRCRPRARRRPRSRRSGARATAAR